MLLPLAQACAARLWPAEPTRLLGKRGQAWSLLGSLCRGIPGVRSPVSPRPLPTAALRLRGSCGLPPVGAVLGQKGDGAGELGCVVAGVGARVGSGVPDSWEQRCRVWGRCRGRNRFLSSGAQECTVYRAGVQFPAAVCGPRCFPQHPAQNPPSKSRFELGHTGKDAPSPGSLLMGSLRWLWLRSSRGLCASYREQRLFGRRCRSVLLAFTTCRGKEVSRESQNTRFPAAPSCWPTPALCRMSSGSSDPAEETRTRGQRNWQETV